MLAFYVSWAASFAAFLWFLHAADAAMDKTGIGDFAKFDALNQRASAAFFVAFFLWCGAFVRGLVPRGQMQLKFLTASAITFIGAVVSWLVVVWGPYAR